MHEHEKINYVEFPAVDLIATKRFFTRAFDWQFEDYGPEYTAFSNQGLDGGFFKSTTSRSSLSSKAEQGCALIILYSKNLQDTQAKVLSAGGVVSKEIFSFPGGQRFHFIEPSGNELAVWSDAPPLN